MSALNEIGDQDRWICWLCDQLVDPDASVNSDLGPSVDTYAAAKAKKGAAAVERLAHRACNTMKGKHAPVIAWPAELLAGDPAPIFESAERLARKGGRETVARFSDEADANRAADWLIDRLGRLSPEVEYTAKVMPGGGQYTLALFAGH